MKCTGWSTVTSELQAKQNWFMGVMRDPHHSSVAALIVDNMAARLDRELAETMMAEARAAELQSRDDHAFMMALEYEQQRLDDLAYDERYGYDNEGW